MRPRFTVGNLLLLTLVFALAGQLYRNHRRQQHLEATIAMHEEVRAQAKRVRMRELELKSALRQVEPELQSRAMYRWLGGANELSVDLEDSNIVSTIGLEFTPSAFGARRASASVRSAQLKLAREKSLLVEMERIVEDQLTGKQSVSQDQTN